MSLSVIKKYSRAIPSQFELSHRAGNPQFFLVKETPLFSIFVSANAKSSTQSSFKQNYTGSRSGSRSGTAKAHVTRQRNRSLGTRFRCFVTSSSSQFPFSIDVGCRSLCGQIVFDYASFIEGNIDPTEGPESVYDQFYRGPNLTFAELVNVVVSNPTVTPLSDPSQQMNRYFDDDVTFSSSPDTRYGHWPVHTTSKKVSDSVANLLNVIGLSDTLADFVEGEAADVGSREAAAWNEISKATICRV